MLPVLLILLPATALCDGGALLFRKEAGPLAVALFASPTPLSVGTVDLSVLLQNRKGLEPVLDADVSVSLRDIQVHPTHELAANKLLYATPLTLTDSGSWQVDLTILWHGESTHVSGTVDVAPARGGVTSYWTYLAFPPLVIVGFIARERLIVRKERRLCDARLS